MLFHMERTPTGTTGLEQLQRELKLERIMDSQSSLKLNHLIMATMMRVARA